MRYGVFVGIWLVELYSDLALAWAHAQRRGGEVYDFREGRLVGRR